MPHAPGSLRASIAAVWREDGAPRTQPILIASVCSGIIGITLADALALNLLVAYVLTVVVVFALAAAALVLLRRAR